MVDYKGARSSNAGDDFHELWVARQAIRLLSNDDGLEAIAVEGLSERDEQGTPKDAWNGVDCALYFGGRSMAEASCIQIVQLKYSSANPRSEWTVSELVKRTSRSNRDSSVIGRLATAWKHAVASSTSRCLVNVILVTNRPIADAVVSVLSEAAQEQTTVPNQEPNNDDPPLAKLAYAAGLTSEAFKRFAFALTFEGDAGSRLALEEQLLGAVAEWAEEDVRQSVASFRQFIRNKMMLESANELITCESVRLNLTGVSSNEALFPCPPKLTPVNNPVCRVPVRQVIEELIGGHQNVLIHGQAGTGKTTALQEVQAALPCGSVMVTYDCYGGGSYLNSNAYRHRNQDAFLQVTNELASQLKLPLFLVPKPEADYPRLFYARLELAASTLARQWPEALIVIVIDAADNSFNAAKSREERSFTKDFFLLEPPPENVRFIVTCRSGHIDSIELPSEYREFEIAPFELEETKKHVSRFLSAPDPWHKDFHYLSNGIPRIQAYALAGSTTTADKALERLMPHGKSLKQLFAEIFQRALSKSGDWFELAILCAGLITLPRPVPISHLAGILGKTPRWLVDVCTDLAPGVRLSADTIGFADEDFEDFVRQKGKSALSLVRERVANRLLAQSNQDEYSAFNVATVLYKANRRDELLRLVSDETSPNVIQDPMLRKEAELHRVRLAIKVCREAGDASNALRFVLIGSEGVQAETALRQLLKENLDCAARFANETFGRLILSDATQIESHGRFIMHRLAVDADRGDNISYRIGMRSLYAWLQNWRKTKAENKPINVRWRIENAEISSMVEAAFKVSGPSGALDTLNRWRPKSIAYDIMSNLSNRLVAEGLCEDIEALARSDDVKPLIRLALWAPLALAGKPVDIDAMAHCLDSVDKTKLRKQLKNHVRANTGTSPVIKIKLELVILACELLTAHQAHHGIVERILEIFAEPKLRRIDRVREEASVIDLLARAYSLAEVRGGREPKARELFRPAPEESVDRGGLAPGIQNGGEKINAVAMDCFDIYVGVAEALVDAESDVDAKLKTACEKLKSERWSYSHRLLTKSLRHLASVHVTTLFATKTNPVHIKSLATVVHGEWLSGRRIPHQRLVERICLRSDLHSSLVNDVALVAKRIEGTRIGAREKSQDLVHLARLLLPISESDAMQIFNSAIEVVKDLDWEVVTQIGFLSKLVVRFHGSLPTPRETARKFSNVVADAAICLEGYDDFPWRETMCGLARMDLPLALANAARWEQEGKLALSEILSTVIECGLDRESISPQQAVAATLLDRVDEGVLFKVLTKAPKRSDVKLNALVEEVARITLLYQPNQTIGIVCDCIRKLEVSGFWISSLLKRDQLLKTLSTKSVHSQPSNSQAKCGAGQPLASYQWEPAALIDTPLLQHAILRLRDEAREENRQSNRDYFSSARAAVNLTDRIRHLDALAGIRHPRLARHAMISLLDGLDEWAGSPAVQNWCRARLPEVVVDQFDCLAEYSPYDIHNLLRALDTTQCGEKERQNVILCGVERHVDSFRPESLFFLSGLVAESLQPEEAADLINWYVSRLDNRVPDEHKDQSEPGSTIPEKTDEAIGRFLFAYLGDCDLRLRWRAAHAVRCLARLGDACTLRALAAQYSRREEAVFRANKGFYWLAARLWFVIAFDRIAGENPAVAGKFKGQLLEIALDDEFPHLLVRSFARDACEKLIKAGELQLQNSEVSRLSEVGRSRLSRLPRVQFEQGIENDFDRREGRRFTFDGMDTIPYWYKPLVHAYANVNLNSFLDEAERWIVNIWGYSGDRVKLEEGRPRGRFGNSDWSSIDHRHGSIPTVEGLDTHLEWHAMWCAAGELLKCEPLAVGDPGDLWDELDEQVKQIKLTDPPWWSADLRLPEPLQICDWETSDGDDVEWAGSVGEAYHRNQLLPEDRPGEVVVFGSSDRRVGDRWETVSVTSALVDQTTSSALVRSLQTMGLWDYGLPLEGGIGIEIDQLPYRLLGWLRVVESDGGLDCRDPFRAYTLTVRSRPGERVVEACNLTQDASDQPRWSSDSAKSPMFCFESWGPRREDHDSYPSLPVYSGDRLLVDRQQLLDFLRMEKFDLIVNVEVNRRGRRPEEHFSGKGVAHESNRYFVRAYRLDSHGSLEIAEGRIGPWASDCGPA